MNTSIEEPAALSPLKRAYLALEQAQARCRELERARSEAIAVVGMACRLPGGADSPDAYWQLLHAGVDALCEVPADRFDAHAYYDPDPAAPGKMCTLRGGYLREPIDRFDPQFFGISPREAESMDPQQRLLLEVAWEALENAAQVKDRVADSATGVFIGITSHDYADLQLAGGDLHRVGPHLITGNTHNAAAGRLSYCFGFQGPCVAIDTACSSSLVAVHLARRSLLDGECRCALAGGVNLILSPVATIALSQGRVLAADGYCRAFDAAASGMVRSEGCAIVVLKRLSDALADHDNILALIRSTAVNQDGPSSGLTVPNGPAQEALIRQALANGGLKPDDIDYVEAHGTGTPLGDPIELRALASVFGAGRERPLVIGSVKTNLGHLEACAGIAGLVKVVLSLQHGQIPPHLHFSAPTPHLPWRELPFVVPTALRAWPSGARLRSAGVSSFGFSGVNAHAVLQEAPERKHDVATGTERPLHLLVLSGRTEQVLRQSAQRYADHLQRNPGLSLGDGCFSAATGRQHATQRLAVLAGSLDEARDRLAAFAEGRPAGGIAQGAAAAPPKIAFLFSGQGSQYAGMGRQLYETQPTFRRTLQRCDEILRPHLPHSLLDVLYGTPAEPSPLDDTAYAQPALFALEFALAELWQSWGVQPAVVLGHSLGEYAAACVAGVFGLEDGLRLVAERGRLMQQLPRDGAMLSVDAALPEVEQAIRRHAGVVAVAAHNAPGNVVVSGRADAVAVIATRFAACGVRTQLLRVSHAFHSPLQDPILDAFERRAGALALSAPRIALVSNLDGGFAGPEIASAAHWRRHLREPVRFADGVAAARGKGCSVFLEIGPKPTLIGLAQQSLDSAEISWLPSLRPGRSDWEQMLESLAGLYTRGVRIDWTGFDRDYRRRRVVLPTTPFQRQRCWLEPPSDRPHRLAVRTLQARVHPLLGERLDLAGISDVCFQSHVGRDSPVFLQDHNVFGATVLPASAYLEIAVAAACSAFGGDAALIENVSFRQALCLPEQHTRVLQTVLKASGADKFTFEIYSRTEDRPGEPWLCHAAGTLCRPPAAPALAAHDPARLADDAGEAVDVDALYRGCEARGIGLGPRFRALRRAWSRDQTALGEISLSEELAFGASAYRLHPVLLDAALHAMGGVFADRHDADVYLPVALDRLRVHGRAGATGWSRVRVEAIRGASEQSLRVDIELLAADGRSLAALDGLHLKRASREQWAAAAAADFADWLYEVQWQPSDADAAPEQPGWLPGADEIGSVVLPALLRTWVEPPELAQYAPFLDAVEEASVHYVLAALTQLGAPLRAGQRIQAAPLADRLGIATRHRRLFERLLSILVEAGILARGAAGELRVEADADNSGRQDPVEALRHRYPDGATELALLQRCGKRLADVLTGSTDPLGLLFPEDGAVSAARLYGDSPGARAVNECVRGFVQSLLQRLPAGRAVRILEIGAGTGATTASLLPVLPAARTDYLFTDISPLFLHRAAEKFAAYPCVRYRVLDIERAPVAQGLAPHACDLIIAGNVLHATRDLRQSLRHVHELLAPGGLLVLLEGTTPLRFIDLIFGLTEGWWRFADADLRPAHPLLDADRWQGLLDSCGFQPAGCVSSARGAGSVWSTQALIVAEARPLLPAVAGETAQRWLILAPPHSTLADALQREVEAAGDSATLVHPAATYTPLAGGAVGIDPAAPADFDRMLAETATALPRPLARIVNLWPIAAGAADDADADAPLRAAELGCEAALHLVQAILRSGAATPPELWLITQDMQPVGERNEVRGVLQAPIAGFAKVAALEHPEMRCVCVDVDGDDATRVARQLYAEIRGGPRGEQLAFRAGRRYVARLARHAAPAARPTHAIRPDATYLITGGQRGLGLATAKWLVEQGARSLVLVGRSDAAAEIAAELAALRRAGATVEPVQGDVADAAQMARVLADIDARLPPLRGIVHAAGVLDDGILAQQTVERFRGVLAPKALGAWRLHVLTRARPLDFFVMYSSLASLLGSAGQANHAAANAFLDALAHHRQAQGLPALSINWGVWSEIGAAARHRVGQRVKTLGMGTIAPAQGMRIFEHLLARPAAQVGVAPIDWTVLASGTRTGHAPPFFAHFLDREVRADIGRPATGGEVGDDLAAASPAERRARITAHLRTQVAGVLRLAADQVDTAQPLNRIGLDSLMAVELRNRLRTQLGLDVPLVRFMEDTSIAQLAAELGAQLTQKTAEAGDLDVSEARDEASLLAQLDQLTDEEVDALLDATLADPARRAAGAEGPRHR